MGIFRAIVQPATGLLLAGDAQCTQSRPIGSQTIRHNLISGAVPLQHFLQKFQCRFLVARLEHEAFKLFALVIDGAPKVVSLAVDPQENFVQLLTPMA